MQIKRLLVGDIGTNCYIIISGGEIALIDPGDETEKILSEVNKYSGKIKYIIHTHYHYDHCLASMQIKKYSGAKLLIHENEKDFVENFIPDQYFIDGDFVDIGDLKLKVVLTPGHTRGSVCLFDAEGRFVFTGDTLFFEGYGRTDLPGGDEEEMERSLKLLNILIKPEMTVYPGHGEVFTRKA